MHAYAQAVQRESAGLEQVRAGLHSLKLAVESLRRVLTGNVTRCSCGHEMRANEWRRGYVGVQVDSVQTLELSNCAACGSTRAIEVRR